MSATLLLCPACQSDELTVYEIEAWNLNQIERKHSVVKIQDDEAEVNCDECGWSGMRRLLRQGG